MFKVEDKVVCISNPDFSGNYSVGEKYIVIQYPFAGNILMLNDESGSFINRPMHVNNFALYNEVIIKEEKDYYTWLSKR